MNKNTKNIIILVILIVIAIGIYAYMNKSDSEQTTDSSGLVVVGADGLPVVGGAVQSELGNEFLATLLNLRTLRLDDSIFINPAFRDLKDFSLTLIQPGNEGRSNPFAPLGYDNVAVPVVQTPQENQGDLNSLLGE